MDDVSVFVFVRSWLKWTFHFVLFLLLSVFVLTLPFSPEIQRALCLLVMGFACIFAIEQRLPIAGLIHNDNNWTALVIENNALAIDNKLRRRFKLSKKELTKTSNGESSVEYCGGKSSDHTERRFRQELVDVQVGHVTPLAITLVVTSTGSIFSKGRHQKCVLWVDQLPSDQWRLLRSLAFLG